MSTFAAILDSSWGTNPYSDCRGKQGATPLQQSREREGGRERERTRKLYFPRIVVSIQLDLKQRAWRLGGGRGRSWGRGEEREELGGGEEEPARERNRREKE